MIGPVILPLDEAVSAVASASNLAQASENPAQTPVLNHVHVFDIVRSGSGILIAGHASHSSHSSHVSSAGGGGDDSGGYSVYTPPAPPVYTAPVAPTAVSAVPSDGSAVVSWAPVSTDDGGVVTYTITVYPGAITRTVVGATTATLDGLQNGTAYSFTVFAANSVGQGPASVASGTIVPLAPQLAGHPPIVVGTVAVRYSLKAETPGWASGTAFSYQWQANGVSIAGATESTYIPPLSLAGKRISVSVSGTNPGYAKGATGTSSKTLKLAIASMPRISGKAKVGIVLHARAGSWTKGTKLTYTWFVGGKKVANDQGPALLLDDKHLGKKVTVKVMGSKSGYARIALKSTPTAAVKH
jgi:hypothetical protein